MRVAACLSVWGILLHLSVVPVPVAAQVTIDGSTATQVETLGDRTEVRGGAFAGNNLFHSFREFSIPLDRVVHFYNPATVNNIINRITGTSASRIDGTIAANSTANVFLINPNGIIFGANARLNIGGSFLATTADSLRFADGREFSAVETTAPVLSMSVPIGLQFGPAPGEIVNRSTGGSPSIFVPSGLRVPFGQTIALVGGEVRFEGGNLTAYGGRIAIGSVGSGSYVSLLSDSQGWRLGYEGVSQFRDIRLSAGASLDASGPAGTIGLQGRQITLEGVSQIALLTSGLDNEGNLTDGSVATGDLTITASDSISLTTPANAESSFTGIFTQSLGDGDSGNIYLSTERLSVRDGSAINAGTVGTGNAGQLVINASDSVEIVGVGQVVPSILTTSTQPSSITNFPPDSDRTGQGGNIIIHTRRLTLRGGGQIQSATADGTGNRDGLLIKGFGGPGGTIEIKATESIEVSGSGRLPSNTGISGQIFREVPSSIITSTGSADFEQAGSNAAGNIRLDTGRLRVDNGGQIAVNSFQSSGAAGNLRVNAGSISLDNQAILSANSSSGSGGNIELTATEFLSLRGGSRISANAGNQGDGGNILIIAPFIFAVPPENSDISANAEGGRGGNVIIITESIFGIQFRDLPTDLSDITVSSRFAQSGTFTLSRFDTDPQGELVNAPAEVIDTENLIVRTCGAGGRLTRGEFTITGRGGLPSDPDRTLEIRNGLADFGDRPAADSTPALPPNQQATSPPPETIIEAKGWIIHEGKIVLVDRSIDPSSSPSPFATPDCHLGSNRS
jgi:filamentous hemagglutinin family protein